MRKLRADGLGASAIAEALKIGRSSVYRVLEEVTPTTPFAASVGATADA
jgi:hypothetical protein